LDHNLVIVIHVTTALSAYECRKVNIYLSDNSYTLKYATVFLVLQPEMFYIT